MFIAGLLPKVLPQQEIRLPIMVRSRGKFYFIITDLWS